MSPPPVRVMVWLYGATTESLINGDSSGVGPVEQILNLPGRSDEVCFACC